MTATLTERPPSIKRADLRAMLTPLDKKDNLTARARERLNHALAATGGDLDKQAAIVAAYITAANEMIAEHRATRNEAAVEMHRRYDSMYGIVQELRRAVGIEKVQLTELGRVTEVRDSITQASDQEVCALIAEHAEPVARAEAMLAAARKKRADLVRGMDKAGRTRPEIEQATGGLDATGIRRILGPAKRESTKNAGKG